MCSGGAQDLGCLVLLYYEICIQVIVLFLGEKVGKKPCPASDLFPKYRKMTIHVGNVTPTCSFLEVFCLIGLSF